MFLEFGLRLEEVVVFVHVLVWFVQVLGVRIGGWNTVFWLALQGMKILFNNVPMR